MIGQTVSHYRILEELGCGGMGVVYKAEDTKLKRIVALKFLPPELTRDSRAKARFIQEAQAASALDHPNICTIHEIGETEDGRLFICMACYEGETVKQSISRKPLELGRAIDIALSIAEGLAQAHEKGIFHRDLKPANVFVTTDGHVKVVDFGLAKLAGRTKLTETGMTAGTVAYMSPEQAKGQEVDRRTDIWSLGVTLYEMVTGQLPFRSDYDEAVVYSILNERAEPVTGLRSGVPMEFERIIAKCMEKAPDERYQTASDLAADLRHLQRTRRDDADTLKRRLPSWRGIRSLRMWSRAFGVVVVLAVIAGVWLRYRTPSTPTSESGKVMLVVLPFDNLGSPDDEYFAAGITEEITSQLASIDELGVISRKSAIHYANTDKTARQIGAELGVQYLLEGTIRWARESDGPNRVRIVPELVRLADDTRLWSETFSRVIDDVFEIQSDIATKVVEKLGLTLLEGEGVSAEAKPTDNLDAYHAYLRGQYYTGLPHFVVDDWIQAISSYSRAVELDSSFVLAHAKLAEAHARLYYYRVDLSEERRDMAKAAADKAFSLSPNLPEVHLAMGYYLLMVERDVERAFAEFEVASRDLPDNAEVLEAKGDGYRQAGKWLEAFDHYERACQLSPLNPSPLVEIAISSWQYRRYAEAVEAADKAIAIAPEQNWPYLTKGLTYLSWRGASDEARRAFELVPSKHNWLPWVWFWQMVYEAEYLSAIEQLSSTPGEWIRTKIAGAPKALYQAHALEALGQSEGARDAYETARTLLEPEVVAYPNDPRYHSSLGVAYAALGREEDAIREGNRATELLPISKDALYGTAFAIDLAHIYTLVGDHTKALTAIEELLSTPSMISVPLLEVDPRWDRLRDLPEFQQLLNKYSVADS